MTFGRLDRLPTGPSPALKRNLCLYDAMIRFFFWHNNRAKILNMYWLFLIGLMVKPIDKQLSYLHLGLSNQKCHMSWKR